MRKNISRDRINNKSIRLSDILMTLVLFEPNSFFSINSINYLYMVAIACEFIFVFPRDKKKYQSPVLLFLLANRMFILLPTIIYHEDIAKCIYFSISFVTLFWVFERYYLLGRLYDLAKTIQLVFTVYLLINIYIILKYPNGVTSGTFFLGIRTRFTDYAFPVIIISTVLYLKEKKKLVFLLSVSIAIINLALKWVATGIVAVIIFAVLLLVFQKKNVFVKKFGILYNASIIVTILVVFFNFQKKFAWFITTILKKDVSLSARTLIWSNAISIIKEKIILGHGLTLNNGAFAWDGWQYMQAHNQILQSLYESGILGTSCLLILIYLCGSKINMTNNKQRVMALAIFVYMIIMITEIYMYYVPTYCILFLAYFLQKEEITGPNVVN